MCTVHTPTVRWRNIAVLQGLWLIGVSRRERDSEANRRSSLRAAQKHKIRK
jgi:hypothetical protein